MEEAIASYPYAEALLQEINFPKDLIVNYSVKQFLEFIPFAKC